MNKKYLMLDIDGVCNSFRTSIVYGGFGSALSEDLSSGAKFDPITVGLLKLLQEEIGFKIVISSSWRILANYDHTVFHKIFDQYGWDTRDIIIGCTGRIEPCPRSDRGYQIETWLKENDPNNEAQYCILDDSCDFLNYQKPFHVRTRYEDGFLYDDYERVREIFGVYKKSESGLIVLGKQ